LNRPQYDRRVKVAEQLVAAWYARGARPWEKQQLTQWFRQATRAAHVGDAALPPLPAVLSADEPTLPEHRVEDMQNPKPSMNVEPSIPRLGRRAVLAHDPPRPPQVIGVEELVGSHGVSEPRQRTIQESMMLPDVVVGPLAPAGRPSAPPRPHGATRTEESQGGANASTATMTTAPARINLELLAARIKGFNLALQSVEDELANSGDWTQDRLVSVMNTLTELISHREISQLYVNLLTSEQRHTLDEFDTTQRAVSRFRQRLIEARQRVTSSQFHGSEGARRQSLTSLDAMTRTVAQWTMNP
jgi:hypothetical protein